MSASANMGGPLVRQATGTATSSSRAATAGPGRICSVAGGPLLKRLVQFFNGKNTKAAMTKTRQTKSRTAFISSREATVPENNKHRTTSTSKPQDKEHHKQKNYRLQQVITEVYKHGVQQWCDMTHVPKPLLYELRNEFGRNVSSLVPFWNRDVGFEERGDSACSNSKSRNGRDDGPRSSSRHQQQGSSCASEMNVAMGGSCFSTCQKQFFLPREEFLASRNQLLKIKAEWKERRRKSREACEKARYLQTGHFPDVELSATNLEVAPVETTSGDERVRVGSCREDAGGGRVFIMSGTTSTGGVSSTENGSQQAADEPEAVLGTSTPVVYRRPPSSSTSVSKLQPLIEAVLFNPSGKNKNSSSWSTATSSTGGSKNSSLSSIAHLLSSSTSSPALQILTTSTWFGTKSYLSISSQQGYAFANPDDPDSVGFTAPKFLRQLTCDEIVDQVLYFVGMNNMQQEQQLGPQAQHISTCSTTRGEVVHSRSGNKNKPRAGAAAASFSFSFLHFNGVGEPLANPSTFEALELLTHPLLVGISPRRIFLHTAGVIPGIRKLLSCEGDETEDGSSRATVGEDEGELEVQLHQHQQHFENDNGHQTTDTTGVRHPSRGRAAPETMRNYGRQINLVLTVGSAFPEERDSLVPLNRIYRLEEVLQELNYFVEQTGRRVLLHYELLENRNDSRAHAEELVTVMRENCEKGSLHLFHVLISVKMKRDKCSTSFRAGAGGEGAASRGRSCSASTCEDVEDEEQLREKENDFLERAGFAAATNNHDVFVNEEDEDAGTSTSIDERTTSCSTPEVEQDSTCDTQHHNVDDDFAGAGEEEPVPESNTGSQEEATKTPLTNFEVFVKVLIKNRIQVCFWPSNAELDRIHAAPGQFEPALEVCSDDVDARRST
ncbi:unnamed protein product [Amoebophrya sp. A120]|nr:unnamed protein product [Amoebophrya sp. A120]|eukprot:GSA120T00008598001.1